MRLWLRSYRVCEHVCRRSCTRRLRLDEEGVEGGTARGQALVIPNEEATCVRCRQQVERASDMHLVAEARTMVGRRREPVVSRQCRGVSRREVAEVIVGDADDACRVDGHRGCEGGLAGGGA